ncbi:prophage endopeptidase tail family protein [Bacillus massilinigeriensis]|uniref:prophage endopeptidase tail family protein n=1 Tax=Bacillus massilionigeriensis TaxID=1805475 RepID=UPI00096B1AB9|nr:prophage endopeptidase tail family protein [Bacillus massilionigeriensis]
MIEIYAGNTLIQTIRKVMSANVRETLEGEFTLSFTVLAKSALALKTKQLAKLNGQYFEIVQISKSLQGSLPVCSVTCEHVSYILNDEIFNIDAFDFTGDPAAGLNQLLSGTPFSAGAVDFIDSYTMKINQEVSRRAALMQYIAILGGEIEYNGYLINICKHRGSMEYQPVMGSKNVTNVSVSHDSRENASSYNISFFKLLNLAVGDNVHIVFKPLGIDVKTRIISLEYNPFYRYNIQVEVGRYKPSISDTFYRIENSMNKVESSLNDVGSSVDGLKYQMDQLGVSYTIVKNLTVDASFINVTYEVEKGDTHQFHAKYSYATDGSGRITSITLEDIFSELLLKEVSTLLVDATRFEITYADGETASYNYTTDSSGRITGIEKVVG